MRTARIILCLVGLGTCATAFAETPPADDVHPLAASSGAFGVGTDGASVGCALEYRFLAARRGVFHLGRLPLAPAAGVMLTSRHALYLYAGFRVDLRLGDRWLLTPGISAGTYARGDDVDLGGGLEFLSEIELARAIGAGLRVGLALEHMSNGRIYDRNPGANSLTLVVRF